MNYLYLNIFDIIIVKFFLDELHCQVLNKIKSLSQKKKKKFSIKSKSNGGLFGYHVDRIKAVCTIY